MAQIVIALQSQPIKVDGFTIVKEEDGTLKLSDIFKNYIIYNLNK